MTRTFTLLIFLLAFSAAKAQKVDSIFVNLYTDSLKKGTYNYINIVGKLSNGKYLPLDTTQLVFSSSYGKFYGNSLFIDRDIKEEKVNIKATLKKNTALSTAFDVYIKKKEDNQHLKTVDEIMQESRSSSKKKKN